jgi:branched-chain amino acid transport system permease protein
LKKRDYELIKRLLKDFRWDVLPFPGRVLAFVFFAALFVLPLFVDKTFVLLTIIFSNIFVIFAVSWDVLSGYTGMLNFGHALFFGVGAYGSALLYKHLGWQPWATIPVGVAAATLTGLLTCIPALRLRGPYLSLFTLSFPLVLYGLIRAFPEFTGGGPGIWGLPRVSGSPIGEYYIILIIMTVSVLIMWKLTQFENRNVRTGIIFEAIRGDEITARASGINTITYKLVAFAVGGLFAGLAGALYAHAMTLASPGSLSLTLSFQVVVWAVFGGMATIYGSVAGVYALYPLMQILRPLAQYRLLILFVGLVFVLIYMPEGFAVWIRNKIERECPRCKLNNAAWRKECRACGVSLRG